MPLILWALAGTGLTLGGGYLLKKSTDAVEETTSSVIKLAVVGAVLFVAAKHYKVI